MTKVSPLCEVLDCNRDRYARTWCQAHYDRIARYGDVRAHVPLRELPTRDERGDIRARILAKCVKRPEGCVEWTGYKIHSGYGTISWNSRQWVVHRAMWTVEVGPIPTDDDWTLDHLCRNRACVNIAHLEVVTRTENSRRGGGLVVAQAKNATRPECRNGHRYTPENTRIDSRGYRQCISCEKEHWAKESEGVNAKRRADYRAARDAGLHWREARLASAQATVRA